MVCEVCGSDLFVQLYTFGEDCRMMSCAGCGIRFVLPQPSPQEIYQEGYFQPWGKDAARIKELSYESILREAERFIRPGSFLDVGCAFGYSFEVAKRRGWEPRGVEISAEAHGLADERVRSRIILGDFSELEWAAGSFDLVVMFDFLEHALSLTAVLQKAYDILRTGGIIVVVTPDMNSASARLMGKNWLHVKKEHAYYLSQKTLKLLFRKVGFRPIIFRPFWKSVNLSYVEKQFRRYGPRSHSVALKLINSCLPAGVKKFNIFLPQGEILALAKKY